MFKKHKLTTIALLSAFLLGGWFLWGDYLLNKIYGLKYGYILDIRQIEEQISDACLTNLILTTRSGTTLADISELKNYEGVQYRADSGVLTLNLNLRNDDWKDVIKYLRKKDLMATYVFPPTPVGCTRK